MLNARKNILKIVGGAALIIAGLLAIFIGFVVALIVDWGWLLLSLVGLASIVVGVSTISSELKRVMRLLKDLAPEHVKSRIKK